MNGWHYLLLVNIYLLLFYGFYALLLRKETFFQLNRIYLVAASLLSFFIPMIQSEWVRNLFITKEVQSTIYSSPLVVYQFKPIIQNTQITIGEILLTVYLAGMLFLTGRLIWQMMILKKMINEPDAAVAYSFFKKVRIGSDHADNRIIAEHEHVHARQWHSADVLLIESIMIVNWFNPIVYLYRHSIKHIHEYIADRQALKVGTNKREYALLLLSQTFDVPTHELVNPFFNHSLLKLRIKMMQKNKSSKIMLIKYGLSAPLFILMLVLSSATISNSKTINYVNKKADLMLSTPATAIPRAITIDSIVSDKSEIPPEIKLKTKKIADIITPPELEEAAASIDTAPKIKNQVFTSVEVVPEFPGGIEEFGRFLSKNTRYPKAARDADEQGRVILTFIVEPNGALSDIHVVRGVSPSIDKEALRVMSMSPKWKPGVQNGRSVRVAYTVPIAFTLSPGDGDMKPRTGEMQGSSTPQDNKAAADTGKKTVILNQSAGVNPIWVIDGKQLDYTPVINPREIASISVLKGKDAEAFYGEKGSTHGVILVTTKGNLKKALSAPKVGKQ